MRGIILSLLVSLALSPMSAVAASKPIKEHNQLMDHGDGHLMDLSGGMVMGQNTGKLPDGCDKIAAEEEITVHAGHKYAEKFPGRMFAFDIQEFRYKPCTKLTVHFINEDNIRHQWMMHGLPKYLYPKGMFHLEVTGPAKISGTLILPPGDKTYLVHCDLAQHMEKGMKAQLIVGKGSGDLPSIPGISDLAIPDDYSLGGALLSAANAQPAVKVTSSPTAIPQKSIGTSSAPTVPASDEITAPFFSGTTIIGLALGLLLAPVLLRRFQGMSAGEVINEIFGMLQTLLKQIVALVRWVVGQFTSKSNGKALPDNR